MEYWQHNYLEYTNNLLQERSYFRNIGRKFSLIKVLFEENFEFLMKTLAYK